MRQFNSNQILLMKKLTLHLFILLGCLLSVAANAQLSATYTGLSTFGGTWKYKDDGSNQGTAWTDSSSAFSDAAWSSAPAYLGYGDTWIVTCVNACGTVTCAPSCTNKYMTTYFRQKLSITNPAQYDSVRISLKRDDGAVVYVNGVEVWRENMPATGTITYTTGASSNVSGSNENATFTKTIPKSFFVSGINTIAVEVHQDVATSSDLTFDLMLEGVKYVPVPVSLTRGPYLQMGNQTGATVRWRTNIASKSKVEVGTVLGAYTKSVVDTNKVTDHIVRVDSLIADTKYYYRFGTDTATLQGDSMNYFTTVPPDSTKRKMTFALFGDCGRNDLNYQTNALKSYLNYVKLKGRTGSDVLILNGDNAYNSGTDAEFTTGFFNAYSSTILKNHLMYSAPGNHDYNNGSLTAQQLHNVPYFTIFSAPKNGECGGIPSGTTAYYSHDYGNVHFLSLDSYGMEDYGTTRMYDTLGEQVTWIKKDLAANKKPWVIAYWHHPPYTMGSHNSDNEGELVKIRENFIRILERYGVDMVLTGHSHDYERSLLTKGYYGNEASYNKAVHAADSSSGKYDGSENSCPYMYKSGQNNHGTIYVVSGSAGASGGTQAGYPHDALPFSFNDGGMFYFEVEGNRLDAKWIRRDSVIADQFTIIKDANNTKTVTVAKGQPVTLDASWPGTYAWSSGAATRSITFTPAKDTVYTVKDSTGKSCLADQFTIKVIDTTKPSGVAVINSMDDARIYPVPAREVLNLEMDNNTEGNYTFAIYDLQGRLVQSFTRRLGTGKQSVNMDVRSLPVSQVLLLKVSNANTYRTFRFTREE